jgi:hypothetical protein
MTRIALMGMVLAGMLLVPATGFAQISCSRDGLQRAVDLYLAAQSKGDTAGLPLATGLGYVENHAPAKMDEGLIKTAMKIDHHRSLLDPATCQTFTEVIVTNKEKPYVLGTRLRVNRDKIAEIEILLCGLLNVSVSRPGRLTPTAAAAAAAPRTTARPRPPPRRSRTSPPAAGRAAYT